MEEKRFNKGEVIIREGEYGDSLFQVMKGQVQAVVNYGNDDCCVLSSLVPGQFFGEMAVLEGYNRSATVLAAEDDTLVCEISRKELTVTLHDQPETAYSLMRHLGNRLRDLTKDYNEVTAVIQNLYPEDNSERSDSLQQKIKKFSRAYTNSRNQESAEFKRELSQPDHREGFHANVESYPAGTVIFKEGEVGSCLYDIHWGKVGIFTGFGTPQEKLLAELYTNEFFGEMGMLDHAPRSATAVALEDSTTIEFIYAKDLDELLQKNPPKIHMILQHLSHRLRKLTKEYVKACKLVYTISEQEEKNEPVSDELVNVAKDYYANLYG